MPAASGTKSHYKYVSDDGTTYRVRLADYIATQVDGASNSIIGAVLAAGTEPKLGGGGHLRRAIVRDLTNKRDRTVVMCTSTAPMIAVPQPAGASTLLLNFDNTTQNTYTYQGNFLTETRARRA